MALSGTLQTLSLAEIFQTLERSKATGVLRLVSLEGGRDIVFISGDITNVNNRDALARITVAQRLAASGVVDDATLLDTSAGTGTGGYSIISNLRENGLEEDAINGAIQSQLMDELFDVFTWEQANFEFLESNGQDEDVNALVEDSQKTSITIKTNTVLMESARRLDEWQRARHQIPNDHVILSLVSGREQEIEALSNEYPARAIVPYINGARSLAEIIKESVATRLDIYLFLVDLINQELILILTTDQIITNAQSFEKSQAFDQAALLYRHALANEPDNAQLRLALANTLEQRGDSPEAAECYAELAMGYLREGQTGQACEAGRRAVELDGGHFERNTYIQCLESAGRIDEATEQMRRLAEYHVRQEQWIEAKEICHQILSVRADDELSLHVISLAFNHTCDLGLDEREIACVHCNQVNGRDKITCDNCSARLHKLCRNCHSETACSDTVCLYCGKSPHLLETEEQSSGLYEKISDQDHKFRSSIQRAVDLRNNGELDKSLAIWKEISHEVTGNQSVHNHIRELESEIHNQSIEKLIAKGNNYRRGRAFARATKSYQEALRILSPRDPRKPRLESILTACKKDDKRTRVVYVIAGLAVLITSWIAAEPYLQYNQYEKDTKVACEEINNIIRAGGGADSFKRVLAITSELTTRGAGLGERAQLNLVPIITDKEREAREKFSAETLELIKASLIEKDFAKTKKLLAAHKIAYGATHNAHALAPLAKELQEALEQQRIAQKLLEDAPKLYKEAEDLLAANKLNQALDRFKALSDTPDQSLSQKARDRVVSLEKQDAQNSASLKKCEQLLAVDIQRTADELQKIKDSCQSWGKQDVWLALDKRSADLIKRAKLDFVTVKAKKDTNALEAFIAEFPGTAEASQATDLLKNMKNERLAVEQALAKIKQYKDREDWEQLFLHAQRFVRNFGEQQAQSLDFPLLIETVPAGATIKVDGAVIGKSPLVHFYKLNTASVVSIECEKFDTQNQSLSDLQKNFKFTTDLNRSALKTIPVRSAVFRLIKLADAFVVASKGSLRLFDLDGASIATHAVGNLGMLEDDLTKWSQFIRAQAGYVLFPNAADSIAVIGRDGNMVNTHMLSRDIESQPFIYVNELFGAEPRIAVSDNGLSSGEIKGTLKQLQKEHQVIAGPVLAGDSFEQLLVFVSHTGQFVGFDEANAKVSWVQDSGATHVGNLVEVAPSKYLTTLDDSRLALFDMDLDGAHKVWEKPLPNSIVAAPFIGDGLVYLALREEVLVYNQKGIKQLSISPGEEVISVSGHAKAGIAVGCKSGVVKFYDHNSKLLWQHKLNNEPSALLVVENRVYIGTNKGQVIILAP